MQFPKLKILGDIQTGTAPILDQLRLKARMREWCGYPTIQFETVDGSMRSPVRFVMRTKLEPDVPGSLWKGFSIQCTGYDAKPLPDSDWTFVRYAGMDDIYLNGTDIKSLELLIRELQAFDLIFTEEHPKATFDEDFYETYLKLKRGLKKFGDIGVTCKRSGEIESQYFTDHAGRSWEINFDERIHVSLDGVRLKEVRFAEADTIVPFIKRELKKVSPEVRNDEIGMKL
ncbi:hypothetical protein E0H65_08185 [Rhizobium leguminosarum bv. viciae]|nr:hypothetical protein E0H65_08185 [Rhizobium leguminosarum bv. viciae]